MYIYNLQNLGDLKVLKPRKKISEKQEIKQDFAVELYFKTIDFFKKYTKQILIGTGVVVALIIFIVFYNKSWRVICAWLLLFAGYFLMSMLSRWYTGGWFNVLIPFHQLICLDIFMHEISVNKSYKHEYIGDNRESD